MPAVSCACLHQCLLTMRSLLALDSMAHPPLTHQVLEDDRRCLEPCCSLTCGRPHSHRGKLAAFGHHAPCTVCNHHTQQNGVNVLDWVSSRPSGFGFSSSMPDKVLTCSQVSSASAIALRGEFEATCCVPRTYGLPHIPSHMPKATRAMRRPHELEMATGCRSSRCTGPNDSL